MATGDCIWPSVAYLARSAGGGRRALKSETDMFESGSGSVCAVAWSIDGKVLASGETDMFESGSGSVCAVAWSIDGKVLASGGADKRIILWEAKKGERLTELNGHR